MAIRNFRQEKNISPKEALELYIKKNHDQKPDTTFDSIVAKMCNLSKLAYVEEKPADVFTIILRSTEFYIPLTENVDIGLRSKSWKPT
jgi:valyl-tRNA synthetase